MEVYATNRSLKDIFFYVRLNSSAVGGDIIEILQTSRAFNQSEEGDIYSITVSSVPRKKICRQL